MLQDHITLNLIWEILTWVISFKAMRKPLKQKIK